jgi:hypothetical protein
LSIKRMEARTMTAHIVHLLPELAGGFLGYWTHHARHRAFQLVANALRRVR